MVKKLLFSSLLLLSLQAGELMDKVKGMLSPRAFAGHQRLLALLFENESAFSGKKGYDMLKVAQTLEKNGLLDLSLQRVSTVEIAFECEGQAPLLLVKAAGDALRETGFPAALTKSAHRDRKGFVWRVMVTSDHIPDPVGLGERLAKRGIAVTGAEREDRTRWRYRLDLSDAKLPALSIEPGERKRILRPVRPVWLDVTRVSKLDIRESPGSHWYADVAVYDKMLKILSMRQNDTRTRFLRLRLPKGAAYVRIGDRFTLENLRSGLRISASGRR
ncbi:hypothetical protein [Hydrogenimonas sp. SS33]|uniref:hypothetical protein n=1 Tax=Hydrogenimonas leucolamina TaxID=2954236 RepID=UPI00336BE16A